MDDETADEIEELEGQELPSLAQIKKENKDLKVKEKQFMKKVRKGFK
jgi:hypothetical protein